MKIKNCVLFTILKNILHKFLKNLKFLTDDQLILQYARNSPENAKQPRGKFWFCEITQKIASFLGKVEIKRYRFHSLRRTAATWLANQGIFVIQFKYFGRWKSTSVAEVYSRIRNIKNSTYSRASR